MKKKVLSMLITFAMLFSMLPATALAVEGEGTTINLSEGSYTIKTAGEYAVLADNGENTLTVKANATITLAGVNITAAAGTSAISIESGSVTLIVDDDSTLIGGDNGAGIYVAEGASVTIRSKSNAELTAIGNAGVDDNSGAAGIGGTYANGNSGAITIDGASVVAKGYGVHGSGIGSGSGKVVGKIQIINGANVTAYGGYYADGAGTYLTDWWGSGDPEGGAAIGGGGKTSSTIADIIITDSVVAAYGGSKAAGIGANFWSKVANITIGGNSIITAQGGSCSAGIGASRSSSGNRASTVNNIAITGGTVTAVGGDFGAGIGTGYNSKSRTDMPISSIVISGGTVTATGGMAAAGIGGGYKDGSVNIGITGGKVTAEAGKPIDETILSHPTTWYERTACAIGSGADGDSPADGKYVTTASKVDIKNAGVAVTAYEDGKLAIEGVANDTLEDAYTEIKAPRTGTVTPAYTKEVDGYVRVWGEGGGNAKENLELKLYADETLIATTKLNNVEGVIDGDVYVTWNFYYPNSNDSYWTTTWEEGHPNSVAQPTKVELYIDGVKVAENDAKMSDPDNLKPVVWRELGGVEQADLVENNGEYTINNLKELQIFRNTVNAGNNYAKKTVKLAANIDLGNEEWTPIGTSKNPFNGTFDGQNYTISNLVITGNNSDVGLFGRTNNGEVKNLTVENAKVSGYLNVGVVAGTPYTSKYTNISVTGHVEVKGYAYVGGVGGKNAYADWTNITVNADETSYVEADSENYRTYVGGVIGFMGEGEHTFKNISSNIDVTGSTCDVGGITGIAHYGNKFIDVTCSGDVTTLVDNVTDACESGGIAGVWHNGGSPVTFEELTYTGSLSAPNVEEEFTFPNSGLIGAPYSSTGTGTIDGDIAAVGGKTYATLAAAINVARADDTVYLLGDATESAQFIIGAQQTITLDLGGNELTCSGFLNYGTLNIKNGALVGNDSSYSTIESTGTLTLTDVDVTGARHAVRIEGGTSIIDGGDYELSGTPGMTTHAINVSDGGEVTIKGGTFTGPKDTDADSGAAVNVQAGSAVNIEGGNFTNGKNDTLASKGTLTITGGTFDQDPSAYVAEGYEAVEDSGVWTVQRKTYTITFDVNGGNDSNSTSTTKSDGTVTLPSDPTRSGYTFKGWYTASSGGTKVTASTVFTADTTVYAQWTQNYSGGGGGSYTPGYSITAEDTENGSISLSPKSASSGTTVTITVDPDKGYVLGTLTVLDKNGKEIELTKKADNKYTFKMPSGKVTVEATFMEDNTMLNYFVDVFASDYYYDAVLWAVENGITNGTSATTFSPTDPCTRAQMATFLWRAAGSPEPVGSTNPFVDVSADAYYAKAVQWAYEQGITGGTSATTFSPDETCTRGQMATFLWRDAGSPAVSGEGAPFVDVSNDAYHATAVDWAYEEGITGGTSATTYSPNDPCTRGQMVTFLYRYLAD